MKRVIALGVLALVPILAGGCGGSHRRGCTLTLRAVPAKGQKVTPAGMQLAQQIATQRLNTLGVSSPQVTVHGDELVIGLAGAHVPPDAAKLVSLTGRLQVFDFEPSLAPPAATRNQQPAPLPSLYALLKTVQKEAAKGSPQSYYLLRKTSSHPVVQGPAPTLQALFARFKDGKQPANTQVLKVPANREPVSCAGVDNCPGAGSNGTSKTGRYWYLFKLPAALTGKDLVEAGVTSDVDPNSGQPIVTLQFTGQGSSQFKRITEAEYNRGRVNAAQAGTLNAHNADTISQYAGHNAIVLDGQLKETPYIDYTDAALSQGIVGNAQITEPSTQAAQRTALVLQSGSLPYTFQRVSATGCSR
jgi:preprotein translocase subunit SecD